MYCLIGYVDSTITVLEKSDDLAHFTGSIAEIMDTYPEYTAFDVIDDMGTVKAIWKRYQDYWKD